MTEIWRSIKGYEGYYSVSNMGRIKSLHRIIITKTGKRHTVRSRIMTNKKDPNGYRSIILSNSDGVTQFRIHRLVATAFIPNPKKLPCVNHIDADRTNNNVSNLTWVTHQENTLHAVNVTKTIIPYDRNGAKNPNVRVNEHIVNSIRSDHNDGMEHNEMMVKYGLPSSTISNIKLRKTWKYV